MKKQIQKALAMLAIWILTKLMDGEEEELNARTLKQKVYGRY